VGDAGAFAGHTDEQLLEEAAVRARRLGLAGPELVVNNMANDTSDVANEPDEAG
jgi:hypothetical protein